MVTEYVDGGPHAERLRVWRRSETGGCHPRRHPTRVVSSGFLTVVTRTLQPELLDALPPGDPDAIHSRRDLRHFNRVMGNPAWFQRELPRLLGPNDRLLELGAGTGELRTYFPSLLNRWDAVDLAPRSSTWPRQAKWFQTDVRDFDQWNDYTVILANLFLHHLSDGDLETLGRRVPATVRAVICCEPARGRQWQWLFRALCFFVGANHVSRHDGHVSIAAGFRGSELPRSLGFDASSWNARVGCSPRGVYRMIAIRMSS